MKGSERRKDKWWTCTCFQRVRTLGIRVAEACILFANKIHAVFFHLSMILEWRVQINDVTSIFLRHVPPFSDYFILSLFSCYFSSLRIVVIISVTTGYCEISVSTCWMKSCWFFVLTLLCKITGLSSFMTSFIFIILSFRSKTCFLQLFQMEVSEHILHFPFPLLPVWDTSLLRVLSLSERHDLRHKMYFYECFL